MEHLSPKTLKNLVERNTRPSTDELDHMETCEECLTAFSKMILQVARDSARKKSKMKAVASG
jgi:hypothetical protein